MKTLRERLLAKAVINWETGCWEWTAGRSRDGYGRVRVGDKAGGVHRVSYEMTYGPVPPGLVIDHLCRVRHCLNPDHLEVVTIRENTLRGDNVQVARASQTHCVNGHEFTLANTYIRPCGGRDCRACIRSRVAAYKTRKQVAA